MVRRMFGTSFWEAHTADPVISEMRNSDLGGGISKYIHMHEYIYMEGNSGNCLSKHLKAGREK